MRCKRAYEHLYSFEAPDGMRWEEASVSPSPTG